MSLKSKITKFLMSFAHQEFILAAYLCKPSVAANNVKHLSSHIAETVKLLSLKIIP